MRKWVLGGFGNFREVSGISRRFGMLQCLLVLTRLEYIQEDHEVVCISY